MVDWNFKNQNTEIQYFWQNQTAVGHSDFIHMDTIFPQPNFMTYPKFKHKSPYQTHEYFTPQQLQIKNLVS